MSYMEELGKKAKRAGYLLAKLPDEAVDRALLNAADALEANAEYLVAANAEDMEKGRAAGMPEALLDRLSVTPQRIKGMADGIRQVAALPNPLGEVLYDTVRREELHVQMIRVPIGVIGMIYESRPNVTADAFALCFKTKNAVILRGGSDSIRSNQAITKVIRGALKDSGIPEDAVRLVEQTDRETAKEMMQLRQYIDLLIPRGGRGLIQATMRDSTIPVIETGTGNCHVYVDSDADTEMAVRIIENGKTQRLGVCNAVESLVIHKDIEEEVLPLICANLKSHGVEIRGDERARAIVPEIAAAQPEDWGTEYLDKIISVKTVDSIEEAIDHINTYSTSHSEAIITSIPENGEKFLREIDSACVYVNASTRFSDGFEFGLGAEIGISTQKLHARGPMGLHELTSYKYLITGHGEVRK